MKKNVIRLLAGLLALVMVLSLAACGNDDKSSSSSSESSSADAAAGDKFATVKAFLDDPDTKAALDEMIESMVGEDSGMSVSVEGSDDTLTYIFKYADSLLGDADISALADELAKGMDEQSSVFENIASSIATVVEVDNPKVVVTYAKEDGTEIYSQTFEAN